VNHLRRLWSSQSDEEKELLASQSDDEAEDFIDSYPAVW
jgi:hypothetical protein